MTKLTLLLVLLLTAGCLQNQHNNGAVEINGEACVACHQSDYHNAQQPIHIGNMATTCGDSHTETSCQPARGGHPEASFAVTSGPHDGIGCVNCHDSSIGNTSAGGANTNCIQCHTQPEIDPNHMGRSGYAWTSSPKNFCLRCHPSGLAEGGEHPENAFPIASGNHRGIACARCHIAADGPYTADMNVSCVESGCHPRSWADDKHDEVNNYQWDPNNKHFCRQCHPRGIE